MYKILTSSLKNTITATTATTTTTTTTTTNALIIIIQRWTDIPLRGPTARMNEI
jgi:hypothetical protein